MLLTLDTLIIIPEVVYTQEVGNETVLLDAQGGRYFSLDPVGSRMWQLICERHVLRQTFEMLLSEYDVSPERLETDLLALVEKMVDKGLANVQASSE